jgi:hypothetical protein
MMLDATDSYEQIHVLFRDGLVIAVPFLDYSYGDFLFYILASIWVVSMKIVSGILLFHTCVRPSCLYEV